MYKNVYNYTIDVHVYCQKISNSFVLALETGRKLDFVSFSCECK